MWLGDRDTVVFPECDLLSQHNGTQLSQRCAGSWLPDLSQVLCCTTHHVQGTWTWPLAASKILVFSLFLYFSWDVIITGHSISKRWNASDSFTSLCNLLGFSFCSSKGIFLFLFFMLTVRKRFHWLVNSTCCFSKVQHLVWTSRLVCIVQIILSNMHCSTFISKCAVALAGYF